MGFVQIDADQVQLAVVYTSLCADLVGEMRDHVDHSSQQHGFEAVLMVQVRVHRRNRQIVVIVLQAGQTFRQLPLVVVEHIRKAGHTVLRRSRRQGGLAKLRSQQIADGF